MLETGWGRPGSALLVPSWTAWQDAPLPSSEGRMEGGRATGTLLSGGVPSPEPEPWGALGRAWLRGQLVQGWILTAPLGRRPCSLGTLAVSYWESTP